MTRINQNLQEYYNSLSVNRNRGGMTKMDFVKKIMASCNVCFSSVQNWCHGRSSTKEDRHLEQLSKETDIPVENLFKTF